MPQTWLILRNQNKNNLRQMEKNPVGKPFKTSGRGLIALLYARFVDSIPA